HGGLLPEEGFVHWLELRKAPTDLVVSGHVEQHGIEGQVGKLHVSVENHSIVGLHLVRVCWKMDDEDIEIDAHSAFVPPATTLPIILDLPGLFDRISEVATLELRAPDGHIRAVAVPFTTRVRKMQNQNIDLLGDL
ncbi:MAG: hypothetical protein ACOYON_14715, partial [Fimbriimonas sp.]